MSDRINVREFIDNLRQLVSHHSDDWWPQFLIFSEHVDRHYLIGATGMLVLFLIAGNISSFIDFVLFCTFVLITSIKLWKYWQVLERQSRRKPITIQPVITTSGNYPTLQKRKYGKRLSQEDTNDEMGENSLASRFGDGEDASTFGASQKESRRSQRYPLSLREWSSVTSPGFTTRVVRQAGLSNNSFGEGRNWNRSPFQYSPDKDLQVGEVAYGSKLKRNRRSGSPYQSETAPSMDIISWTRNRSLTPTTYISANPREPEQDRRDFVKTAPLRNTNEMSPNRNGGLGGIPHSSIMGKNHSQLVASANNILENSKSPYNSPTSSLTPTPPPSSILEALANRKRIRDSEAGFQNSQSPVQRRTSIPSIYNEDLAKGSKRVKFLSPTHDANAVLPYSMMPLPDMRANEDEPMMAESILDQLNQTEKRYLPEDDSPLSYRQGPKKMRPNNVIGSRNVNVPGTSPARKRKIMNSLGPLDEEVQEKSTKMCTCTECYDELAGAKVDQYGNSLIGNPADGDGSRETRSKTIRKVVDQATETEPVFSTETRLVETGKPRVITKEQFKHDKNLRKKRLQIMLELSKEKKAKLETSTAPMNLSACQTNGIGAAIANPATVASTNNNLHSPMLSVPGTPAAESTRTVNESFIQPVVSSVAPTATTSSPPVISPPITTSSQATTRTPDQTDKSQPWGSSLGSPLTDTQQKQVPQSENNLTQSFSGFTNTSSSSTLPSFGNTSNALDSTLTEGNKGQNSTIPTPSSNMFQFGKAGAGSEQGGFSFGSSAGISSAPVAPSTTAASTQANTTSASASTKPQFSWGSQIGSSSDDTEQKEIHRSNNFNQSFSFSGNASFTGSGSSFADTNKPSNSTVIDGPLNNGQTSSAVNRVNAPSNRFEFGRPPSEEVAKTDLSSFNTLNSSVFGTGISGIATSTIPTFANFGKPTLSTGNAVLNNDQSSVPASSALNTFQFGKPASEPAKKDTPTTIAPGSSFSFGSGSTIPSFGSTNQPSENTATVAPVIKDQSTSSGPAPPLNTFQFGKPPSTPGGFTFAPSPSLNFTSSPAPTTTSSSDTTSGFNKSQFTFGSSFGSSGSNQQQQQGIPQSNTLTQPNQSFSSFGNTSSGFSFGNTSQPGSTATDGTLGKDQSQGSAPNPSSNPFQFGAPASTSESGAAGGFNFVPPGGFSPTPLGTASPNQMFSFGSTPTAGTAAPRRRITARGRKYR